MNNLHKKVTRLVTAALCGSLLAGIPAVANAAGSADSAVASSRSFTPHNRVKANLLDESISTTVEKDSNWGGIESLDVPVTKSQAEKDAEARQAARAAQAAQAAQNAQTRNQSGVASRSSQRATQQVAVDDAPVTGTGQDVVNYAMQFQGVPYVWGGETPSGFDCSGFTKYVFAHFGIALPHNADAQAGFGTPVSTPAPGDLMVAPGHVAIYVGNGYMIHAPAPGQTVKVQAPYRSFEYRRLV